VRGERNAAQAEVRRIENRLGSEAQPSAIPHAERKALAAGLPQVKAKEAALDAEVRQAIIAESEVAVAAARERLQPAANAYQNATAARDRAITALEESEAAYQAAWRIFTSIGESISAAEVRIAKARDARVEV